MMNLKDNSALHDQIHPALPILNLLYYRHISSDKELGFGGLQIGVTQRWSGTMRNMVPISRLGK